ncbi:MAG: methylamine utilization protein [Thermoanaerobaculia bacterium]|jgi:plastocyanin
MLRRALVAVFLLLEPVTASAATLVATVRDARGALVDDAVVYAVPVGRKVPQPSKPAVMDQKNRQFLPRLLVIQTGTAVSFPNSDNVRHQVYSFSPAKKFQLPLYEGTPAQPVVFDRAGVVTLGCNIHDRMSARIVVVDTPHFAIAAKGRAELGELAPGSYEVRVWYPGAREETKPVRASLEPGETREVTFASGSE